MNERTTYLGPFFLCAWDSVEKQKAIPVCGNSACKSFQKDVSSEFCPSCGVVRSERFIPKYEKSAYANWIIDDLKDALYGQDLAEPEKDKVGHAFFIPNVRRDGDLPRYDPDMDFLHPVRLVTAAMIRKDSQWLKKAFADEFKYLKSKYVNVQVVWGQLTYWN